MPAYKHKSTDQRLSKSQRYNQYNVVLFLHLIDLDNLFDLAFEPPHCQA